jgi:alpha-D-ribose 1-methylphosphonate 5-phosphate C-P lyase
MSSATMTVAGLLAERSIEFSGYSYAFLDDMAKREIRRATLKAVSIPGHQVPFGSREMPIARGWGTGGLQLTLALVGPSDAIKVIDQGDDASVNAVNLRRLISRMAGARETLDTPEATLIQTRHRIPEERMRAGQVLILQVPIPEPLRLIERSVAVARTMHAEADYARMWLALYEDIVRRGEVSAGAGYPVLVGGRFIMAPSPIPRWDIPKLHQAETLFLFGAGREKRIYAVPPHTDVHALEFEDYPFEVERFEGKACARCGATDSYLVESPRDDGTKLAVCSDTAYCDGRRDGREARRWS